MRLHTHVYTCMDTLILIPISPQPIAPVQGQSSVPPAQAQVLYSTTPLWSALIAWWLLSNSDEAMSPVGWAGGLALVVATIIASRPTRTT